MRIPKYWAKETYSGSDNNGQPISFSAWGWSFDSLSSARKLAALKAKKVWHRFVTYHEKIDPYPYLETPLREEIVETKQIGDVIDAVITRNRYGALVLNSSSVCFVDVDFPVIKTKGFLDSLLMWTAFWLKAERKKRSENETIDSVVRWAKNHPGRSFRLYRTAAGLRLLFTDRLYSPTSSEVKRLLEELGSDALYQKLTFKQECFRARLTPKPWRCDCDIPPNRYPWDTPEDEHKFRDWVKTYEASSESYGICRLLEVFGGDSKDRYISEIVKLHDSFTCQSPELELA